MDILKSTFDSLKIEYYAVLSYSHLKETRQHIVNRAGLMPKTAIIYLLPYYAGECRNISRYAASRDYHIALRETGEKIISELKRAYPDSTSRFFGDHSPIDERGAALIAGLGIAGDNGLLINEKYGSYIFIGEVLTDIPPEELGAQMPQKIQGCEGCGACKASCPTGILRGEGDECLSAITQKKGALTEDETALIIKYNTAWGCDLCQSSCPYNRHPKVTPIEFFRTDRITRLTTDVLLSMSDEDFSKRAFAWRGREVPKRNTQILEEKEK